MSTPEEVKALSELEKVEGLSDAGDDVDQGAELVEDPDDVDAAAQMIVLKKRIGALPG